MEAIENYYLVRIGKKGSFKYFVHKSKLNYSEAHPEFITKSEERILNAMILEVEAEVEKGNIECSENIRMMFPQKIEVGELTTEIADSILECKYRAEFVRKLVRLTPTQRRMVNAIEKRHEFNKEGRQSKICRETFLPTSGANGGVSWMFEERDSGKEFWPQYSYSIGLRGQVSECFRTSEVYDWSKESHSNVKTFNFNF